MDPDMWDHRFESQVDPIPQNNANLIQRIIDTLETLDT